MNFIAPQLFILAFDLHFVQCRSRQLADGVLYCNSTGSFQSPLHSSLPLDKHLLSCLLWGYGRTLLGSFIAIETTIFNEFTFLLSVVVAITPLVGLGSTAGIRSIFFL